MSTPVKILERERREVERRLDLAAPSLSTILPHTWEARGGGDGRTRQPLELYRWSAEREKMGLVEGGEERGCPMMPSGIPYALLTQANDTNDADWFRNRPSQVSGSTTPKVCFWR